MKKLLTLVVTTLLLAGCSSEGDLPKPRQVTPVTPDTPIETKDTVKPSETEPAQPTPGFAAKYRVAKISINVDGNMAVTSKEKADYRGCTIKI